MLSMDTIIDLMKIIMIKNIAFTNQELNGTMNISNEVMPKEHGDKVKWT